MTSLAFLRGRGDPSLSAASTSSTIRIVSELEELAILHNEGRKEEIQRQSKKERKVQGKK